MNNCKAEYKSWVVIITAGLFFCYIFAQIGMFNSLAKLLVHDFKISSLEYGTLSAYYFFGNLLFLIPAGLLLDRFSTVKLLTIVSLITALSTYGFASAEDIFLAKTMRLITGLCGSFALLTVLRLATRWFRSERLALVIGVVVTLAMLGGMLAQTPFIWLLDQYGWRHSLVYISYIGVVITILIACFVKDQPQGASVDISSIQSIKDVLSCIKLAVCNKQNWLGGFSISLLNLPVFVFGATWGSIYLRQVYNLSALDASYILSMVFFGMIVGSPISGWISDNYSIDILKLRVIAKGSRRQPLLFGAVLSILSLFILMFVANLTYVQLLILFFFIGFFSSMQVCGYPLITESNPSNLVASASSISSMLIMSGGFVLPLFGWLVGFSGDSVIVNQEVIYSVYDFNLAMGVLVIGYILAWVSAYSAKETIV